MVKYVLGFMFDETKSTVLLLLKTHPEWQKHKLNGVGGKLNIDETPLDGMVREFEEETGLKTTKDDWKIRCKLFTPSVFQVFVFSSIGDITKASKIEDEVPFVFSLAHLQTDKSLIPNLKWIIPLCLDDEIKVPIEIPYV